MDSFDRIELNEKESAADSSDENFFSKPPPRKRPKNTSDHETNPATFNTRLNAAKKRYPTQKPKSAKIMREINRTGGRGMPIGNGSPAQESRGNRSANGSRRSMTQRSNSTISGVLRGPGGQGCQSLPNSAKMVFFCRFFFYCRFLPK